MLLYCKCGARTTSSTWRLKGWHKITKTLRMQVRGRVEIYVCPTCWREFFDAADNQTEAT
jgi:hypothetical protein